MKRGGGFQVILEKYINKAYTSCFSKGVGGSCNSRGWATSPPGRHYAQIYDLRFHPFATLADTSLGYIAVWFINRDTFHEAILISHGGGGQVWELLTLSAHLSPRKRPFNLSAKPHGGSLGISRAAAWAVLKLPMWWYMDHECVCVCLWRANYSACTLYSGLCHQYFALSLFFLFFFNLWISLKNTVVITKRNVMQLNKSQINNINSNIYRNTICVCINKNHAKKMLIM